MLVFQKRKWMIIFLLLLFLDIGMFGWLVLHDKIKLLNPNVFSLQCSPSLPNLKSCSTKTVQKMLDLIEINKGDIVVPTGETASSYQLEKAQKIIISFDCTLKGKTEHFTYTKEKKLLSASQTHFANGHLDIRIGVNCSEVVRFGKNKSRFIESTLLESLYPFSEEKWKLYQYRRNPVLANDISNVTHQLDSLNFTLFSDE